MDEEIVINRLKKALGSGPKIVFFVGAGISVPSGIKNFQEFNEDTIRRVTNEELQNKDYKLLSKEIRSEVMLQIGIEELGPEIIESLEMLLGFKPNFNHFFLAEALKRENWVFTTNLENLMENACEKRVRFKRCRNDSLFKKFFKQHIPNPNSMPGGYIFKPHGTIEEKSKERFKSIRIALEQVGKGLTDYSEKILKHFLENYDFCFIGYSCRDDFSIYPILLNTKSNKTVFWLQHKKGKKLEFMTRKKIEEELDKEEKKKPWKGEERKWETINVDDFLLDRGKTGKFFKFVGDSSKFIKTLCRSFGIEVTDSNFKEGKNTNLSSEWTRNLKSNEGFKRTIFAGRLFEQVGLWEKAEQCYKEAECEAKTKKVKEGILKAKQRLANLYRMETELKKEYKAIDIYKECIDLSEDPIRAIILKFEIADVERRLGRYPKEPKKWVKDVEKELKLLKDENTKSYARCLRILGLGHLRGSEDDIKTGLNHCEDSKKLMRKLGDKNGEAEAENAIGLLLIAQGIELRDNQRNKVLAKKKINKAIVHLKRAINIRIKYGFFRGCAQHSRNIGDAYRELMKTQNNRRAYYFRKAEEYYEISLDYLDLIKPKAAPLGEILNWKQRVAGLYRDFCKLSDNVKWKRKCIFRIISLYTKELMKGKLFREIKLKSKENKMAKTILKDTRRLSKELGLHSETGKIDKLLKKLGTETQKEETMKVIDDLY